MEVGHKREPTVGQVNTSSIAVEAVSSICNDSALGNGVSNVTFLPAHPTAEQLSLLIKARHGSP